MNFLDPLNRLTVASNRCCFELHLPLHFVLDTKCFVFDTKQTKITMLDPEHDHGDSLHSEEDNVPKTPPITNSRGVNASPSTRYIPPTREQWKEWRKSFNDNEFLSLVLNHASAQGNTLTGMYSLVMSYLNEENLVSPREGNNTYDGTFVSPIDDTDNQTPAMPTHVATPTDKNRAPTTPSKMFSRGGMAVGRFIGKIQNDFKGAMETDEGKAAREKIKSGMEGARSVASLISKSAKSVLEDLASME
jgi:hypothetical protein